MQTQRSCYPASEREGRTTSAARSLALSLARSLSLSPAAHRLCRHHVARSMYYKQLSSFLPSPDGLLCLMMPPRHPTTGGSASTALLLTCQATLDLLCLCSSRALARSCSSRRLYPTALYGKGKAGGRRREQDHNKKISIALGHHGDRRAPHLCTAPAHPQAPTALSQKVRIDLQWRALSPSSPLGGSGRIS